MDPERDFLQLITTAHLAHGMDELSAKLIAILFLEPKEISLEDLSKKTGYSMASISTTMKFIESFGFVERTKKPKSKKIYFLMHKDILELMRMQIEKMYTHKVQPVQQYLPGIIAAYRKQAKTKEQQEKLDIIERYHRDVLVFEKLMNDTLKRLDREIKNRH
ncbi:MAG: hypothetical protein V1725_05010 [archaeon]